MIEILHRRTSAVLYRSEDLTQMRDAVLAAITAKANLRGADLSEADLSAADLRGADLRGANLRWADLREADLREADLSGANLSWANLRWANLSWADLREVGLREANLSGANLSGADLREADLREADLSGANLSWANLSGADLSGANLRWADLREANLRWAREDFFAVLAAVPAEILALRTALVEGRVDGSVYQGECACLVGTIANARHCAYDKVPELSPDSSRPAERWFLGIAKGDTPAKSQVAAITVGWIDEYLKSREVAE